jgi:VWFA-related protein
MTLKSYTIPGTGNLRSSVLKDMISRAFLPLALLIANGLAQTHQAPDVVIRSSAREVLLDLIVRDAHGKLVTNLKPQDITVFEDGVRQDVRAFRLVAGSEVRAEDEKQAAEAKATPAATTPAPEPGARPPVNPLRTVNVVCLILNDLSTDTRAFAFESARKFVDRELRPNTFIGVFTLDSTGMRPVFPFSNNRERLLKAVELASINQLRAINVGSAAMLNGLSMSVGNIGVGDTGSDNNPLGTRHDMTAAAIEGLREIDALKGLIGQLRPLPFQKTVLLLSNGLTRPPDQLEYWDSMIHASIDAGVTFYAVDVHGLDPDYDPMAASSALLNYAARLSKMQAAGRVSPELAHEFDYIRFAVSSANTQEALRELAERTGGFLIANTNNVDELLSHVMEEVDTHYEIAYPPKSERDDGHFRKIEVRLARAGLRVETRTGYFAVPDTAAHPLTPEEMAGLRALDTQPRPHAFDFLSRAYRFRNAAGTAQYAIAFEMPISNLAATPDEATHKQRLHASLLALVKNAEGEIVDRVSKDVPSELSDDHLAGVRAELMTYQHAVNLPPGRYTVETAVVDHEGNRASTGTMRIENRQERGIGLSDLTLVRQIENLATPPDATDPFEYTGKRVLPFVTTDLLAGARPFVYFMIYPEPGNAAKPVLRVRFFKNGRPMATLSPDVPAPDASGGIPMIIELTSKPGSYEVRATIAQGNGSTERTLQYTLAR